MLCIIVPMLALSSMSLAEPVHINGTRLEGESPFTFPFVGRNSSYLPFTNPNTRLSPAKSFVAEYLRRDPYLNSKLVAQKLNTKINQLKTLDSLKEKLKSLEGRSNLSRVPDDLPAPEVNHIFDFDRLPTMGRPSIVERLGAIGRSNAVDRQAPANRLLVTERTPDTNNTQCFHQTEITSAAEHKSIEAGVSDAERFPTVDRVTDGSDAGSAVSRITERTRFDDRVSAAGLAPPANRSALEEKLFESSKSSRVNASCRHNRDRQLDSAKYILSLLGKDDELKISAETNASDPSPTEIPLKVEEPPPIASSVSPPEDVEVTTADKLMINLGENGTGKPRSNEGEGLDYLLSLLGDQELKNLSSPADRNSTPIKSKITKVYRKLAEDFQNLEDLMTEQKGKTDSFRTPSPSPCAALTSSTSRILGEVKSSNNIITIENINGDEGNFTRITLIKRKVIENKQNLEFPYPEAGDTNNPSRNYTNRMTFEIEPEESGNSKERNEQNNIVIKETSLHPANEKPVKAEKRDNLNTRWKDKKQIMDREMTKNITEWEDEEEDESFPC